MATTIVRNNKQSVFNRFKWLNERPLQCVVCVVHTRKLLRLFESVIHAGVSSVRMHTTYVVGSYASVAHKCAHLIHMWACACGVQHTMTNWHIPQLKKFLSGRRFGIFFLQFFLSFIFFCSEYSLKITCVTHHCDTSYAFMIYWLWSFFGCRYIVVVVSRLNEPVCAVDWFTYRSTKLIFIRSHSHPLISVPKYLCDLTSSIWFWIEFHIERMWNGHLKWTPFTMWWLTFPSTAYWQSIYLSLRNLDACRGRKRNWEKCVCVWCAKNFMHHATQLLVTYTCIAID